MSGHALITGGSGFIGTNMADRLLREGRRVVILDDLSRPGVTTNLRWLQKEHGSRLKVEAGDIRDANVVRRAVTGADLAFHFAAQVAVTTSLVDPVSDFEVNARGTLNLLEAIRALPAPIPVLYTSTNKVYGTLADVDVTLVDGRYAPTSDKIRSRGIGEAQPIDFHSPYGCSKGAADQYVLDYARIYAIPAVVFRMSCIYGPHQRGNEDQGWVAHFLLRALAESPITIYGDGRQVRDALYAEDLVDAMLAAHAQIDRISGRAFNIGGGPDQAISLLDLLGTIERLHGRAPNVDFAAWRPADQRYYVSDISAFMAATGWSPKVSVEEGVGRLYRAFVEQRERERQHGNDRAGDAAFVPPSVQGVAAVGS
jgi:CDP-paratose 2-epimerase